MQNSNRDDSITIEDRAQANNTYFTSSCSLATFLRGVRGLVMPTRRSENFSQYSSRNDTLCGKDANQGGGGGGVGVGWGWGGLWGAKPGEI